MTMAGLPKGKTPDDFLNRRSSLANDECTVASSSSAAEKDGATYTRRSLADRARVFDKSYVESPQKRRTAIDLQKLLDNSKHRKQKNVTDGRRDATRSASDPTSYIVDSTTSRDKNPIWKAMLLESDHRKQEKVSDGIKQTYRPAVSGTQNKPFSIIPTGSVDVPTIKMGDNMQKLLDDSR
eukprot:CAMPEP_0176123710 /NCGR_PEP_ID=MMETSP0120_2-20121206/62349_1 /TAXON_ID=160619 /ORGANISM="Kryptoperidinium foliaceum, Strain CCMP 1326" /LENGTH=180 /DNA_ID=CAMNT_0017458431 /DNA_START=68 /DNA_END=607 /DNA_ORIENTATION=+